MTGVILQARLDSSRLPAKALLNIAGKTSIRHAMAALKQMNEADVFILATDAASAGGLADEAAAEGFVLYKGDKDDVLKRFAGAVQEFGLSRVVRATGDNPLVSAELADATVRLQRESGADYAAFSGAPLGTGVEVVTAEALLTASRNAHDPYEREHVCPHLYRRPELFSIRRIETEERWLFPAGRVTLDTLEDYRYIARIFDALYCGSPVDLERLVRWLRDVSERGEGSDKEDSGYPVGKTG